MEIDTIYYLIKYLYKKMQIKVEAKDVIKAFIEFGYKIIKVNVFVYSRYHIVVYVGC